MWRGELVVGIWDLIELFLIEREREGMFITLSLSTKKVRLKLIDKK
jgi:hypothetical protein